MKTLTLLLMLITLSVSAQKKITHHDTTITNRVEYAPDTIAVWFKEIIIQPESHGFKLTSKPGDSLLFASPITDTIVFEHWTKGFVIWQVHHIMVAGINTTTSGFGTLATTQSSGVWITGQTRANSYYDYNTPFQPTQFSTDHFLYADKKTPVKNRVLYTILRK